MTPGVWALALFFGTAPADGNADSGAGPKASSLEAFVEQSASCPKEAKYCIGIAVHVVVEAAGPVRSPIWLAERIAEANRHFAPIDVGFRVKSVEPQAAEFRHLATRRQRDLIGRKTFSRGVIHLHLVGRLDDVDAVDTEIRGVHWRDRVEISRRWVIMSGISSRMVLAHELGHFFSLPHSRYPISIMNKRPREKPPREERTFAAPEIEQMREARDQMLRDGDLVSARR